MVVIVERSKLNGKHGLIVLQLNIIGILHRFHQDGIFTETTQIPVRHLEIHNVRLVAYIECFNLVGRENEHALFTTQPQFTVECFEGRTLFHLHVKEPVIFVEITNTLRFTIKTRQAIFRYKPQVFVLIFYNRYNHIRV